MRDEDVKTYGQIYAVLEAAGRAIDYLGKTTWVKPGDFESAARNPIEVTADMLKRAKANDSLEEIDSERLAELFDKIDPNVCDGDTQLDLRQQGIFMLAAMHEKKSIFWQDDYVGTSAAAESLQVTKARIGQLIKEGDLKAKKERGRWYIEEASIEKYKEQRDNR